MPRLPANTALNLLRGRAPGQLVIQYTDHCNASCPQCGMRRSAEFRRSHLGVDRAKRVIDEAAAAGIQALSFTGGEPLLFLGEVVELLRHAQACGIPYLRTGTNGFLFRSPEAPGFQKSMESLAEQLAGTGLYTFWISIDSADPARHEAMRGFPGVIRGIEKALPIFHRYGIYPSANLGLNRNMGKSRLGPNAGPEECARACEDFYRFVAGLGFTIANACYPMSVEGNSELEPVYAATADADLVRFTPMEKATLYQALADTIPRYRGRLRIFTPRSSLHSLAQDYRLEEQRSYPCRGGHDFFFVDAAEGGIYPCGYRGGERLAGFDSSPGTAVDTGCRKCDWECFRDPSELLGPLMELRSPTRLGRRLWSDPTFFKLWLEDLRYYRACDLFNGRMAPDSTRLARFAARS